MIERLSKGWTLVSGALFCHYWLSAQPRFWFSVLRGDRRVSFGVVAMMECCDIGNGAAHKCLCV